MDDLVVSQGTSGSFLMVPDFRDHVRIYPEDAEVTSEAFVSEDDNFPYYRYVYSGGSVVMPDIKIPRIQSPNTFHIHSRLTDTPYVNRNGDPLEDNIEIEQSGTNMWFLDPGVYYSSTGKYASAIVVDNNEEPVADRLVICVGGIESLGSALVFHGPWSPDQTPTSKYQPIILTGDSTRYTHSRLQQTYVEAFGGYWSGKMFGSAIRANTERVHRGGVYHVTYTQPPHNNWKLTDSVVNSSLSVTGDNAIVVSGTKWFHTCGIYKDGDYTTTAYDRSDVDTPEVLYQNSRGAWRIFHNGADHAVADHDVKFIGCAAIPYFPLAGMPYFPVAVGKGAVADMTINHIANFTGGNPVVVAGSGAQYINKRWSFTPRVFTDADKTENPHALVTEDHQILFSSSSLNRLVRAGRTVSNYYSASTSSGGEIVITGGTVNYSYEKHAGAVNSYCNQLDNPQIIKETAAATVSGGGVVDGWSGDNCIYTAEWQSENGFAPGWYQVTSEYTATYTPRCAAGAGNAYLATHAYLWTPGNQYAEVIDVSCVEGDDPECTTNQASIPPIASAMQCGCSGGNLWYTLGLSPSNTSDTLPLFVRTLSQSDSEEIIDQYPSDCPPGTVGTETITRNKTVQFLGTLASSGGVCTHNLGATPSVTVTLVNGVVQVLVTWGAETKTGTGTTGRVTFESTASTGTCADYSTFTAESATCVVDWNITTGSGGGITEVTSRVLSGAYYESGFWGHPDNAPDTDYSALYTNSGGQSFLMDKYNPTFPTLFNGYSGVAVFAPSGAVTVAYKGSGGYLDSSISSEWTQTPVASGAEIRVTSHDELFISGHGLEHPVPTTTGREYNGTDVYDAACIVGRSAYKDGGEPVLPSYLVTITQPVNSGAEVAQCYGSMILRGEAIISSNNGCVDSSWQVRDYNYYGPGADPSHAAHDSGAAFPTVVRTDYEETCYGGINDEPLMAYRPMQIDEAYYLCPYMEFEDYPCSAAYLYDSNSFRITREGRLEYTNSVFGGASTTVTDSTYVEAVLASTFSSGCDSATCSLTVEAYLKVYQEGQHQVLINQKYSQEADRADQTAVQAMLDSGAGIYNDASGSIIGWVQATDGLVTGYTNMLNDGVPPAAETNHYDYGFFEVGERIDSSRKRIAISATFGPPKDEE